MLVKPWATEMFQLRITIKCEHNSHSYCASYYARTTMGQVIDTVKSEFDYHFGEEYGGYGEEGIDVARLRVRAGNPEEVVLRAYCVY